MKHLFRTLLPLAFLASIAVSCTDHEAPGEVKPMYITSKLEYPLGVALDNQGQTWVTENGSGDNNGRVSLVKPDGTILPAITNFRSEFANGSVEGMGHLLFHQDTLFILNGMAGRIYSIAASALKPGNPVPASALRSQLLRPFVDSLKTVTPYNSNAYNLTAGPDGDLYIVDAGANVVIKRQKNTGILSYFAKFPRVGTPFGTMTDAVPTGITFDGSKFLVTTLSGFPFSKDSSRIFQVNLSGKEMVYKKAFTTTTDLTLTSSNKALVVEHGVFSLTAAMPGFQPNTGRVATEDGYTLVDNINKPTAIERWGSNTYYVIAYGSGNGTGSLIKFTY